MATELVNIATDERLKEMDWTKSIEICEIVASDHGQGKHVIKSIKKRLQHKDPNAQLLAVLLLEMLLNNCGEHVHKEVIDNGLLPILVKIVKKKSEQPVREKIFLLLDATQTALGGASGKFPQYYAAYYDLVSARVQFPQRLCATPANLPAPEVHSNNIPIQNPASTECNGVTKPSTTPPDPASSIIEKASSVLEVLCEVLDGLDARHPQVGKDEFTLDLVEQCSFQKQRVMHLVMTSRDEMVVSRAIELNEQLQKALAKHDALVSVDSTSSATFINDHEEPDEEEDPDLLLHRIRKGKACAKDQSEVPPRSLIVDPEEKWTWAKSRPLCIKPVSSNISNGGQDVPSLPTSDGSNVAVPPLVSIPPPPSKHVEREKFFKEKADGSSVSGHMRGLSLHSRNGSSRGGSADLSDKDPFDFQGP